VGAEEFFMTVATRLGMFLVVALFAGQTLHADDEDKKPVKLPDAVTKAWSARFQKAEIVSVKEREEGFEIKAKDELNDSFKVLYGSDGRIVSEKKHKISLDNVPSQVKQTAKQWASGAVWLEPAVVETKKGGETVYEMTAEINGDTVKTRINSEGRQVEAGELKEMKESKEHVPDYKSGPRVDHVNRIVRCC